MQCNGVSGRPMPCKSKSSVNTTCPYCGVGCGVTAKTKNKQVVVDGNPQHPANFGKLCSKGYALADTLSNESRLLKPSIDGVETNWVQAISRIAREFETVRSEYGPESIAFYVSGQLLTEDYYVANKFVKGYLGTANIDTNSRLCMASSVAAHKRAFGSDTVPGCYEDLEQADVVVLVGSNLSWCHPVLFQRIQKAKQNNPKMQTVVLDPRRTATAELCDHHFRVKAGGESDAVIYLGLLRFLAKQSALDKRWIDKHANGIDQALEAADAWTVSKVAQFTGLSASEVLSLYELYRDNRKVVTVYSQGVNQSHKGTDTVNAIINVHLATGKIGREGCGPFSITGQPNAMGGREVGGLANMLACHMDLENEQHRSLVRRFWRSPRIANKPGLKAIDLFSAVKQGKIKALWIMATNPADSMPNANEVSDAIAKCPFVVVSDVTLNTDTAQLANVLLPANAWSEKDGTVTNSERRISRQTAFRTAPTNARPDWWAIAKVAQKMGYKDAFAYTSPSEIFAEYAALSGFQNKGSRDFDISAHMSITPKEYDSLKPFQWPQVERESMQSKRFFADGGFYTQDGKAKLVAVTVEADQDASSTNTFTLNTGRIRDQWHTMTRTGISARLSAHVGEPFIEINPLDAQKLNIKRAGIVDVHSVYGSAKLRALLTDRVAPKETFVPMHWTNMFASSGRVNATVHAKHDPVSGQPALKSQTVMLAASPIKTYGFMLTRHKPDRLEYDYWAIARVKHGWKTEFASNSSAARVLNTLLEQQQLSQPDAEVVRFDDEHASVYRAGWFVRNNRLESAVFLAAAPVPLSRQAIVSMFDHDFKDNHERLAVVSGAGLSSREDVGAIICSCMQVGAKTIQRSIDSGCSTVQQVGDSCGAGTQCGTCRSDIRRLLPVAELA